MSSSSSVIGTQVGEDIRTRHHFKVGVKWEGKDVGCFSRCWMVCTTVSHHNYSWLIQFRRRQMSNMWCHHYHTPSEGGNGCILKRCFKVKLGNDLERVGERLRDGLI